ncbi:hypothetical protein ACFPM3_31590 [Streptomyces coeruleoprunus]|uniref:Uncharacterized protein n=1 Tax=Streptomyces coeruleoprunus TaxID=285563 RepID=A0ABV9XNH5_9ACTN
MEAELVALASAGATALVQQMVGDTWEQVRGRVAAFFARRSGRDVEAIGEELDDARADLVAAGESGDEDATAEAHADARAEWRNRMRRALRDDPQAAAELRALLDELEGGGTTPQQVHIETHNTINGGVYHNTVIQAGSIGRLEPGAGQAR